MDSGSSSDRDSDSETSSYAEGRENIIRRRLNRKSYAF